MHINAALEQMLTFGCDVSGDVEFSWPGKEGFCEVVLGSGRGLVLLDSALSQHLLV